MHTYINMYVVIISEFDVFIYYFFENDKIFLFALIKSFFNEGPTYTYV